ncbi:response regulator [Deltaproteobacteria bacterium TL4]
MNTLPIVLVIDDEVQIRRLLRLSLSANGYQVVDAANGQEGLTQVALNKPDVIILDLGLPDMSGIEVLQQLREWSHIPVIVLSVREGEREKVAALDLGADDYLTKPFSMPELLARIRVAQRHSQPQSESAVFQTGHLKVDLSRRLVWTQEQEVKLTKTEYALLRLLVQHAGRVLTHRQILKEVWGGQYVEQTHYLRVYMAQLRRKIEVDANNPALLITESGIGYRLTLTEEKTP